MNARDGPLRLALLSSVHVHRELIANALARAGHYDLVAHLLPPARLDNGAVIDVLVADACNTSPAELPDLLGQPGPVAIVAYALDVRDEQVVLDWAAAGALAFVQASAPLDTLIAAIERAGAGEVSCSAEVACLLLRHFEGDPERAPRRDVTGRLTPREEQILALLTDGLSNKAIAYRLGIELGTVKNHVHNTMAKLSVTSRRDAAAVVRRVMTSRNGHQLRFSLPLLHAPHSLVKETTPGL
ncbi:MAG: response regulator transcription factor [Phycisphaerae bacterium]|nr:response regulator transcription factor [Gemmatimonadaceae bacterium]